MGFKKFSSYLEQKQGKFFVLRNDQDYADVVFLYKGYDDMMVCDVHYLKTEEYEGYVECCKEEYKTCPACSYGNRGIRKETKLFIPLYNISKGTLEFWDRNSNFENVINENVFKNYPNPSEYVFRITREGKARDVNTTYKIVALGRNSGYPYEKILADYNLSFPESYSEICKSMTPEEMSSYLNNHGVASNLGDYSYTPVPRGSYNQDSTPDDALPFDLPDIDVPTEEYSAPPTDLPDFDFTPGTPTQPESSEPVKATDSDDSLDDVDF